MSRTPTHIEVYADGSCSTLTRDGGWGLVATLPHGGEAAYVEGWGHIPDATINACEIEGILRAALLLRRVADAFRSAGEPAPTATVFSDSSYAVRAINEWAPVWAEYGWTTAVGEIVKNRERLEAALATFRDLRSLLPSVTLRWVRGHSASLHNCRADALAGHARVTRSQGEAAYGFPLPTPHHATA